MFFTNANERQECHALIHAASLLASFFDYGSVFGILVVKIDFFLLIEYSHLRDIFLSFYPGSVHPF